MRHKIANRKLNRPTDQRLALLKSIVIALFQYKRIQTTDIRAKQARRLAEYLITLSKRGTLHDRRRALKIITHKTTIKNLFSDIALRYENRKSGFTRILKIGFRRGDGAKISLLELVE